MATGPKYNNIYKWNVQSILLIMSYYIHIHHRVMLFISIHSILNNMLYIYIHTHTHKHDKNNLECSYTWHEVIFYTYICPLLRQHTLIISTGVYKRPTAGNIAGTGLKLAHLKLIYFHGGEDGLMDVFTFKKKKKVFIELLAQKRCWKKLFKNLWHTRAVHELLRQLK